MGIERAGLRMREDEEQWVKGKGKKGDEKKLGTRRTKSGRKKRNKEGGRERQRGEKEKEEMKE